MNRTENKFWEGNTTESPRGYPRLHGIFRVVMQRTLARLEALDTRRPVLCSDAARSSPPELQVAKIMVPYSECSIPQICLIIILEAIWASVG